MGRANKIALIKDRGVGLYFCGKLDIQKWVSKEKEEKMKCIQ